jgi:hypothetical protein
VCNINNNNDNNKNYNNIKSNDNDISKIIINNNKRKQIQIKSYQEDACPICLNEYKIIKNSKEKINRFKSVEVRIMEPCLHIACNKCLNKTVNQ